VSETRTADFSPKRRVPCPGVSELVAVHALSFVPYADCPSHIVPLPRWRERHECCVASSALVNSFYLLLVAFDVPFFYLIVRIAKVHADELMLAAAFFDAPPETTFRFFKSGFQHTAHTVITTLTFTGKIN
jgi:hypothetical protein